MTPQVQAAIIKAASDWALFFMNAKRHSIGTKFSTTTLANYFDEAYSDIIKRLESKKAL
jgi:hypothetical protein